MRYVCIQIVYNSQFPGGGWRGKGCGEALLGKSDSMRSPDNPLYSCSSCSIFSVAGRGGGGGHNPETEADLFLKIP